MGEQSFLIGEDIFLVGARADRMVFVFSGRQQYSRLTKRYAVVSGDWLSEAALWMEWHHRGQLTSSTQSNIIGVDAAAFRQLLTNADTEVELLTNEYVALFLRFEDDYNKTLRLSDMWGEKDSIQELVLYAATHALGDQSPFATRSSLKSRASFVFSN